MMSIDKLQDIPEIILPKTILSVPNQEIIIQNGIFDLYDENTKVKLEGKVIFQWLPYPRIYFYGKSLDSENMRNVLSLTDSFRINLESQDEEFISKGMLLKFYTDKDDYNVICSIRPPLLLGNFKTEVDYIHFEVPNFRAMGGYPVKYQNTDNDDVSVHTNRVVLINDDYEVFIDISQNHVKLLESVNESGGFQIIASGKLSSRKTKKVSYENTIEIFKQLSYFLCFINGRRVAPIIRNGITSNNEIWTDFSPYEIDQFQHVSSWISSTRKISFNTLWENFTKRWEDESDKECIITVLHWYVEANLNRTKTEGSIVLVQNALELLFHWIIAETKNYINSKDADNISAAAKISFLLSYVHEESNLPEKLEDLCSYAKKNNINNGPEVFIKIRNCIVHPSMKKRKSLEQASPKVRFEALTLGLLYVEIILLKFLGYSDDCKNRINSLRYF